MINVDSTPHPMNLISEKRSVMEEDLLQLSSLIKSYYEAIGSTDSPSWLFVMGNRVSTLEASVAGYMSAIHEHAFPVLLKHFATDSEVVS